MKSKNKFVLFRLRVQKLRNFLATLKYYHILRNYSNILKLCSSNETFKRFYKKHFM